MASVDLFLITQIPSLPRSSISRYAEYFIAATGMTGINFKKVLFVDLEGIYEGFCSSAPLILNHTP